MSTWIALLRGINVGGRNSLRMSELVRILESLGLQNVRTYIQSGNVVFESPEDPPSTLADEITAAIEKEFGFSPSIFLMEADHLMRTIASNPFPEAENEPKSLHVFFLSESAANPDVDGIQQVKSQSERFHLTEHVFYLHAPDGIGRSKLAAKVGRLLGVDTTARNWRTVEKLAEMVERA